MSMPFRPYQLANDEETYGKDAGKWIVVSDDAEDEFSFPMSEIDARNFAAALTLLSAPGPLDRERVRSLIHSCYEGTNAWMQSRSEPFEKRDEAT